MPRQVNIFHRKTQSDSKKSTLRQMDIAMRMKQASALHQQGQLAQAKAIYEQVLTLDPRHFDALHLSGVVAAQTNNPVLAADLIGKAISINSNHAAAYSNLGLALNALRRPDEALVCFDQALELRPDYAEAYSNRGNSLRGLNRFDEAVASYDRAIELKSDYAKAYSNRGNALKDLNLIEQAVASYDRAIQLSAGYAEAYWNKSLALLTNGEFDLGWQLYEWRSKNEETSKHKRNFSQPLWLGQEDIEGQTILLHAEQGIGDAIQFSRYAALVKARGARVLMEVHHALHGLFEEMDGVDELFSKGEALPAFDYHCPLLSLPLAFKTMLSSIPSSSPYLACKTEKYDEWAQSLGERKRPRVGLVWSGSHEHQNDHNRTVALKNMLALLPQEFEYVSLQKELRDVDKEVLAASTIKHYGEDLRDFSDTAALCELMDVVVSVDTSVAHLAAAIGKATWVLLPFAPDWRWLLDRQDSPWYASVKLYRQDQSRSWDKVLQRVGEDLRENFLH
jgi:tetratricopeptide (TPR) repeat protein